jgi:hypothetical protein
MISGMLVAFFMSLSPYLCTEANTHFDANRQYPADTTQFAHCQRDVSTGTKKRIYKDYGITDTYNYCIDHGISLFAGGNNEIANLWPNLKDEGGNCEKQGLETEILAKLEHGEMTTEEAQQELFNYVVQRKQELFGR